MSRKKLSGIHLPRRLDAVDFLGTYLRSKPIPLGMRAEPFWIEQDGLAVKCSREFIEEICRESIIYKNFWDAACNYAKLMEAKAQSQYVDPKMEQKLRDEYTTARDACINLDIGYVAQPGKLDS